MSDLKESAVPRYYRDQEREELKSSWRHQESSGDPGNSTRKHHFVLVTRKARMQ